MNDFFVKILAVEGNMAEECACKMEHAVPDDILERFVEFVRFMETCPGGGPKWEPEKRCFTGICPEAGK